MEWQLLASLTSDEQAVLLGQTRQRNFAKGEVVFHEGDPADSMHFVESGHLAVRVSTPDGDHATLNVVGPGDTVGELAVLDPAHTQHRSATVIALDPARTRSLSATGFQELCRHHPGVQRLVGLALAQRVRELSGRLLETMYVGLDRRLYRCLLELADTFAGSDGRPVVPLTQEHLADLVGGTRPSVNQVLQRLAAQGIIEVGRGRVAITDHAALVRKAGR